MADWRDKVLSAPTPGATANAFRGKKVKDVMKTSKPVITNNTPGTMKRAYKGRPA